MKVRLEPRAADDATVILAARVDFAEPVVRLTYPTQTGALLRIDGAVAGAFDARRSWIDVLVVPGDYELTVEVERRIIPPEGIPAEGRPAWHWRRPRTEEAPRAHIEISAAPSTYVAPDDDQLASDFTLIGHAHLDIAWLWRVADTRRKVLRTFGTALRQLDLDGHFRFSQSQAQLYAWVQTADKDLFARVRERIGNGWDASIASMWVEPDLHAISGESILRQFALGVRWSETQLGISPTVAWLPDTFGFPATFPQLAAHAGITSFATTKLQWNETTRWPHPQFRWFGDDGSSLLAAVIDRFDGPADEGRAAIARERNEPLICGAGEGGGGVDDSALAVESRLRAAWTTFEEWFERVDTRLVPEYRGELYLETHRGTYTTHRDVKTRNAALERSLDEAEELLAWCIAVRTQPSALKPLCDDLQLARTIVARNQYHHVIGGTSIETVYTDAHVEYDRADRIAARVREGALSILPRADLTRPEPTACVPEPVEGDYRLQNEYVQARVRPDGTIVELLGVDGPNLVALANGLKTYIDQPRAWDAWNLDPGYDRRSRQLKPAGTEPDADGLIVRLGGDGVAIAMRIALNEHEPYLRIELAVKWEATHLILRVEHRFALNARQVRFGAPHGSIVRTAYPVTQTDRARFEVPAQRWVHVEDGGRGVAILSADTYGWNAVGLAEGGLRIGTSLLRAPTWPDPTADRREHRIAYALAPTSGTSIGALEAAWCDYAEEERVRLFTCEDPGVLVVATKPADDGNGIVVRVRECDGMPHDVELRSGGRVRSVQAVDACERAIAGDVVFDGEALRFVLPPFALRSFRVNP